MNIITAYQTLGLVEGASKEEILAAYRKLAKQWHPDVNKDPEAEETFKKISQAYELLTKPLPQQQRRQQRPQTASPFSSVFFNFEDIFEAMNQQNNSRSSSSSITLELEDASSPQMANKIIQILSENGIKVKGYSFVTRQA